MLDALKEEVVVSGRGACLGIEAEVKSYQIKRSLRPGSYTRSPLELTG